MKYLAIDFGSKRIGLATSDDMGLMAFPHSVVKSSTGVLEEITTICKDLEVNKIIFGLSQNYKGQENVIMTEAREFANQLSSKTGLEVLFEPEHLSSVEAEKMGVDKNKLDAVAATIILNSFLNKNKK